MVSWKGQGGAAAARLGDRGLRKADRELMRDVNTSLVINLVKTAGQLSRADLARESNLSPATISAIVGRLVGTGVLSEVAVGQSSGGRPPVLLSLNPRAAHVVGIKLKESGLTTVVTDLNAEPLVSFETELSLVGEPAAAIAAIDDAFKRALREAGISRKKVLGVGIGLPGVVDPGEGIVHYSEILRWREVALEGPLRHILKTPVWVDNDVNTVAVADKWFGGGLGARDFITVTVGRGIGLGIVVGGVVYRGAIGGAGEFGHITVAARGPLCQCGRIGCLETFAAEPAIRAAAGEFLGRTVEVDEVVALADSGNASMRRMLADAGEVLGKALANLITILNPERLIVSGEGVRLGRFYFEAMKSALKDDSYAGLGASLPVVIEPWGDDAWAIGAATLVLRELFQLPIHSERPSGLAILAGA